MKNELTLTKEKLSRKFGRIYSLIDRYEGLDLVKRLIDEWIKIDAMLIMLNRKSPDTLTTTLNTTIYLKIIEVFKQYKIDEYYKSKFINC